MRRTLLLGLVAAAGLAGCKGYRDFGKPSAPAPSDPVKAAQSQSSDALSRAQDAQKDAQRKQDQAQSAQKDVADAQRRLTEAQAKAQQEQAQAQAAQQKALSEGQQAAQVATQASQQAAQGQAAQAAQYQAQQHEFAQRQSAQQPPSTPPALDGAAQAQAALSTETGKLAQVNGDNVVVDRGDKGQLPLATDGSTQVLIDGKVAAMTDLKPGAEVRVAYPAGGPSPAKAQRIEVTTPPAPGISAPISPVGGKP